MKTFKREIVKRVSVPTGTIRNHEPTTRVVRHLSCGHTQVESHGGRAKFATEALCKTCRGEPSAASSKRTFLGWAMALTALRDESTMHLIEANGGSSSLACGAKVHSHGQIEKTSRGRVCARCKVIATVNGVTTKPNPRDLFMPRTAELETQCPSCPFLDGNDAEFGGLTSRLLGRPATLEETSCARANVRQQVSMNGEFVCHNTAYTLDGALKPPDAHRQCPGATKYFKACSPEVRHG